MTRNYYRTGNYNFDHSTYGGEISQFDFDGHPTLTGMADKIARQFTFDRQCRKNIENRIKINEKKGTK